MTDADREYCSTCCYLGKANHWTEICEYFFHTGHCRSVICPPGVGCTCHSKFEGKVKRETPKGMLAAIDAAAGARITRSEYAKIDKRLALAMYRRGRNDGEISRAFGCSVSAVRFWRRSYHLPANIPPGNPNFKKENLQ